MTAARHHHHHHDTTVPKPALWAALVLILASIALAASARSDLAVREQSDPLAPARAERLLRFEDRADGAIVVTDAATGEEQRLLAFEGEGFVRGVMRGMFRARKLDGLERDAPFRLAREADGRLTLTDPQTRRRVDLHAFGPSNLATFERLLQRGELAHAR